MILLHQSQAVYTAFTGRLRWAHARRKFYDMHLAHGSVIAAEAVHRIGQLYDIEREIRGHSAESRREIRETRARPLMDDLRSWLEKTLSTVSRKSDTAEAIRYALSRWSALTPRTLERWHSAGQVDPDLFGAAERFRTDLGRAGFSGSYARLNLFKTRAGQQELSDRVDLATVRVREALNALGRGKEGQSQSQSCVWNCECGRARAQPRAMDGPLPAGRRFHECGQGRAGGRECAYVFEAQKRFGKSFASRNIGSCN